MRFCGIVSEYNPFHNGHALHIALSREKTGADYIICVMSGSFVQRGEPAIFDKWTRAACALLCGADAVIELPLLYAVQSAEGFASGGVAVLEAAGAKAISFGCETDDIEALSDAAERLNDETGDYKRALKEHLQSGLSFPKARMKAAYPETPDEFCMPNAILAIEYMRAVKNSSCNITPYAIQRVGEGYHSEDIGASLASATAIRKAFKQGHGESALSAMPEACAEYISKRLEEGLIPVMPSRFDRELMFGLRRGGREYIKTLPDVSEGLENRIYDAASQCYTREELIASIKTKRYTYTRISRILLYALLGITKDMVEKQNTKSVEYIRVLGARSKDVLSALSSVSRVPVIAGSVASTAYEDIDIKASDVYALSQSVKPFSNVARDYTEKLIIADELD